MRTCDQCTMQILDPRIPACPQCHALNLTPQPPATGDGEEPITFDELLDDFAELRKLRNSELTDRLRQILHVYVSAAVQEAVKKSARERQWIVENINNITHIDDDEYRFVVTAQPYHANYYPSFDALVSEELYKVPRSL